MNLEIAFIKSNRMNEIGDICKNRINKQINLNEYSSLKSVNGYEHFLKDNTKRKIALYQVSKNFIGILESKEFNDYSLMGYLSKELDTIVVSVVISEVTGDCGHVIFQSGELIISEFREEEEDLIAYIQNILENYDITNKLDGIYLWSEIMQNRVIKKTVVG